MVADVPKSVVTVTSTVPVPAGDVTVIEVSEFTVTDVPAVDPKLTDVSPVKPLPDTVTTVPPESDPELGVMLVTVMP